MKPAPTAANIAEYWLCQARNTFAQAFVLGCNAIFCACMAYCAALDLDGWRFTALALIALGSILLIPRRIKRLRFCRLRYNDARFLLRMKSHHPEQ